MVHSQTLIVPPLSDPALNHATSLRRREKHVIHSTSEPRGRPFPDGRDRIHLGVL